MSSPDRTLHILSESLLQRIYRHACSTYPDECCGFVFADGASIEGSNIQNDLHRHDPQVYQRTAANGYTFSVADTVALNRSLRSPNPVTVVYHSHPDVGAYFSDEDQDKALFAGQPLLPVSYLVIDVRAGQAHGAKLFEWRDTGFVCSQVFLAKPNSPLTTHHREHPMNVVLFPEVLAKVARLPGFRLEAEGQTLREVINHLCTRHTDLRAHLFYENDKLKEHFLFTSAGELVDPDRDLQEGSEVDIMMATSGGMGVNQLSNDEVRRYVRHITLPEVGREGQLRLKNAKVLIIGTGGLGSPASLYLAAAGVGTLGLIDFDVVESSNLQRQVVHGISTLGMPKVESAKRRLQDLNETITVNTYNAALDADNALPLIGQYDLVVDGTDNFSTRYLVNDACARLRKPLVYGAIYRFDGQMSVFNHGEGPCYRCLFPNSPPPELAPNCSAGGVIGVLPGVVGLIQATEALKLILQIGEPLVGRLMRFDAMAMKFSEVRFKRRADCRACSPLYADAPLSISELVCSNAAPTQTPLAANFFIEPLALKQMMESGSDDCVLVDVRDANELEVCKLPGAIHIPLIELEERVSELSRDRSHYLVCYGGMRAERAANTLLEAGFVRTQVLQGGMKRWVRDVEPDMPIY